MSFVLLDLLGEIEDQREFNGKEYSLKHILFFTVLALLSNVSTYIGVQRFIEAHFEKLKEIFHLKWRRVPTHSCIWRIIVGTNINELERVFRKYSYTLSNLIDSAKTTGIVHISFDGKSLRGSFSKVKNKNGARIFEAFESLGKIILAHIPLESDKNHELYAFEEFLKSLNLEGVVISADALHCQKKTLN
jgi:hypothetical protein